MFKLTSLGEVSLMSFDLSSRKSLKEVNKKRVFRLLVEDREPPRVEESTVLMDLQQEVDDVPVPVGHSF